MSDKSAGSRWAGLGSGQLDPKRAGTVSLPGSFTLPNSVRARLAARRTSQPGR